MNREQSTDRVDRLLSRFYAGDTTPGEVAELEDYFISTEKIPPCHAGDARLFMMLRRAKDETVDTGVPDGLLESLEEMVDRKASGGGKRLMRRLRRWSWQAAAVAVLAVGIGFAVMRNDSVGDVTANADVRYTHEVTDSLVASEISREAIAMLAASIGKARTTVARTGQEMEEVNSRVHKILALNSRVGNRVD